MAATLPSDPYGCFVGVPVLQPGGGGPAVAVKDNIDMAGLPTRGGLGCPGVVAARDAPVVAGLRAAGFGLLGKTRMDEAAFGATGDNPHHGRTENPATPGHSPGGSSGGSAAAVASGMAPAALGTDTLGSVRIPASYCGLLGLKPSRGVLPMEGVAALSPSLDHVGVLARDAGLMAQVLRVFLPDAAVLGPGRIGVPALPDAAPETRAAFEEGLATLRRLGWVVDACTVAGWNPGATRRAGLLLIEAEGAVVFEGLVANEDPAMSPATRAMLRYGRDCGTGRLVRAIQTLRAAEAGLHRALETCDLLAMPTTPAPAYAWADGPPPNQGELVALANWGGFPAISVPMRAPARPVGLQLIGRPGDDWRLVQTAAALMAAV
jgi:aspartyl-tRNA(Asn)/glutamyl-tRNA(Gln) amidotransferase subunit A